MKWRQRVEKKIAEEINVRKKRISGWGGQCFFRLLFLHLLLVKQMCTTLSAYQNTFFATLSIGFFFTSFCVCTLLMFGLCVYTSLLDKVTYFFFICGRHPFRFFDICRLFCPSILFFMLSALLSFCSDLLTEIPYLGHCIARRCPDGSRCAKTGSSTKEHKKKNEKLEMISLIFKICCKKKVG